MRFPLPLLALTLVLSSLLSTAPAQAQSTTPPTSNASVVLPVSGFIIRRGKERTSGEQPFWLNREDCLKDDLELLSPDDPRATKDTSRTVIEVTPNLRGFNSTMNLEVWIGTSANCTDSIERRGGTTGRCWNVYSKAPTQSGVKIAIRPRQVIAQKVEGDSWDSEATCDLGTDRVAITMYLMLLKGGNDGDVLGTSATWDKTLIDIAAPPAPTDIKVSPGDGRLFPDWFVASANDLEDTFGFRFYCEELGAGNAVGQGGAGNFVGQGGGAGAPTAATGCSSAPGVLFQDMRTDAIQARRCGFATGRAARSGQAAYFVNENGSQGEPLKNDADYAIGVTTSDLVFNESKLSSVVCASPKEVTTFFEAYRDAGGKGGGAYCGYAPGLGSWHMLGLGLGAFGLVGLRRWRRAQ